MIRVTAPNFGVGAIFDAQAALPQAAVNTIQAQRQTIAALKAALNKERAANGKPPVA